ncbi:hypothetical protein ACFPRL_24820 [Pseudoclavibacter helvolus]
MLALELLHLSLADARGERIFAGPGEAGLAVRGLRGIERLVEATEHAKQRDLLVEGGEGPQDGDLGEARLRSVDVDALAEGLRVVAEDDGSV